MNNAKRKQDNARDKAASKKQKPGQPEPAAQQPPNMEAMMQEILLRLHTLQAAPAQPAPQVPQAQPVPQDPPVPQAQPVPQVPPVPQAPPAPPAHQRRGGRRAGQAAPQNVQEPPKVEPKKGDMKKMLDGLFGFISVIFAWSCPMLAFAWQMMSRACKWGFKHIILPHWFTILTAVFIIVYVHHVNKPVMVVPDVKKHTDTTVNKLIILHDTREQVVVNGTAGA